MPAQGELVSCTFVSYLAGKMNGDFTSRPRAGEPGKSLRLKTKST